MRQKSSCIHNHGLANGILLLGLFQNCLKKKWLKELLRHLQGFIKTLWWISSADQAVQLPLRSVTQGPCPALHAGIRNADTQPGSMPTHIIQIEFSGKFVLFWWVIKFFSFSFWLWNGNELRLSFIAVSLQPTNKQGQCITNDLLRSEQV